MKILDNVLTPPTYKKCANKLQELMLQKVWGVSRLGWDKGLLKGVSGDTSMTLLDDELAAVVLDEIGMHLPKADELMMQFYIWHPYSGIAPHNDGSFEFGATIYLNHSWPTEAGGLFVWWEDETDLVMKAICPSKNMMVLNDEKQRHMVTQVSPYIQEPRCTIQIWGMKA